MRPVVYIAAPLQSWPSHNIHRVAATLAALDDAGYTPIATHFLWLADAVVPRTDEEWLDLSIRWLQLADAVLRLDGKSPGADIEVEVANRLGIPVFRDRATLDEWRREAFDRGRVHRAG